MFNFGNVSIRLTIHPVLNDPVCQRGVKKMNWVRKPESIHLSPERDPKDDRSVFVWLMNFPVMEERGARLSMADETEARLSSSRDDEAGTSKNRRVSYSLTKSFIQGTDSLTDPTTGADASHVPRVSGPLNIVSEIEGTQEVLCVSYTETCDFIAAGLTDGTIRLIKVSNGEYTSTLRDTEMQQNPGPTTAIKHRPVHRAHPITQTLLATYATGCVKSWHYPSGQCLYTIRENRQTLGLAYHPQLPKFVTVGDDTNICLYNEETKTMERAFHASDTPDAMNGHRSRVFSACFNPKSFHEIISGGWDDTIQFWDTRQPYAIRRINGPHICGEGLDISRNGKEILTCSWSKALSLQLWDYGTGKLIVTLEPDSWLSQLYTGRYMGNSLFVATGGCESNLFRIVDLRSHSTLASMRNLPGGVYSMDTGPLPSKRAKRAKHAELPELPKIAFCCGKKIYEVEVG